MSTLPTPELAPHSSGKHSALGSPIAGSTSPPASHTDTPKAWFTPSTGEQQGWICLLDPIFLSCSRVQAEPKQCQHISSITFRGLLPQLCKPWGKIEQHIPLLVSISSLALMEALDKNKRCIFAASGTTGFSPPCSLGGFELNQIGGLGMSAVPK